MFNHAEAGGARFAGGPTIRCKRVTPTPRAPSERAFARRSVPSCRQADALQEPSAPAENFFDLVRPALTARFPPGIVRPGPKRSLHGPLHTIARNLRATRRHARIRDGGERVGDQDPR